MATLRVPVPGGSIAVWPEGTGAPALVLHGGPGLSDYTDGLANELRPGFQTIRYQQRGLRPSTQSGPLDIETNVADAIAVLDALSIHRALLVGHSWGGMLAMHIAVASPEHVAALLLIDSLGAIPDGGIGALGSNLSSRYEAHHGRPLQADAALVDLWPFYFADPGSAPPMPPVEDSVENRRETFRSLSDHYKRGTLSRGLRQLAMPTIFVHGLLDPLPPSASVDSAALIQNSSTHLLEDCGHFPWMELPGRIREIARVSMGLTYRD